MITIPCPWCEHEMPLGDDATPSLRCDDCATIVDLAVGRDASTVGLSLAA